MEVPDTAKVDIDVTPPTVRLPEMMVLPCTENVCDGVLVPMPTLPPPVVSKDRSGVTPDVDVAMLQALTILLGIVVVAELGNATVPETDKSWNVDVPLDDMPLCTVSVLVVMFPETDIEPLLTVRFPERMVAP